MSFDFAGRIALVNGASRGIGAAIASALGECGAHVIATSRKLESVAPVAAAIEKAGGSAEALACHAGRLDQIDALMKTIGERHGRLDLLVNNAATNPYYGPAAEAEEWAFDKTVAVNLKGPLFLCSKAVPLMRAAGGGAIVNVASIAALSPAPLQGIYAMTKAALVSLTRTFAKEHGADGIRVNAILPGLIDTQFASALTEDPRVKAMIEHTAAGRVGQPEEMTGGVLYLLSDRASYTTGTTLVMDGGLSIL